MATVVQSSHLLLSGNPVRFYLDCAERPWVAFSLALVLLYLVSFWLELPYLSLLVPWSLVGQGVAVVAVTYFISVRRGLTIGAAVTLGAFLGLGLGLTSALLALVRFGYVWLVFNLIAEPLLSLGLGLVVSLVTVLLCRLWLRQKTSDKGLT